MSCWNIQGVFMQTNSYHLPYNDDFLLLDDAPLPIGGEWPHFLINDPPLVTMSDVVHQRLYTYILGKSQLFLLNKHILIYYY
jgi:hypothetical protein